jgi:hypothetical protein
MVFVSTIKIFQGSVLMMTRAITRLLLGDCAMAMAMTIITHEMVSPCWISQYIWMICHTGEMRSILYSLTEVSIADHQGSNEAIDGDGPQQLVTWDIFDHHSFGRQGLLMHCREQSLRFRSSVKRKDWVGFLNYLQEPSGTPNLGWYKHDVP